MATEPLMTTLAMDARFASLPVPTGKLGPVTRQRITRSIALYALLVALGFCPLGFGWSAGWQAAGIGLWFPGAGFLAAGGWAVVLFPIGIIAFALAVFFWFGAGMTIAPPLVWIALAACAGAVTGAGIWPPAPYLAAGIALAFVGWTYRRHRTRGVAGRATYLRRAAMLPTALAEMRTRAVPAPPPEEREMDLQQLAAMRYALDRGLQPVGEWNGFDIVDEFQPAARRYQINMLAYALALAQHDYAPSFHGYLAAAQRGLIERYLLPEVWRYWIYESAWGHLNFRKFDPAAKDNIMLTGFLGLQLGLYMSATGDRRYMEPGSLVFQGNGALHFAHDAQSIARSVSDNFRRSAFCLYPCEPNWIYSACNHYGMATLTLNDRLTGGDDGAAILPRWLHALDTEMTDASGSIVGLRSLYTGFEFTFPSSPALYAGLGIAFLPERAWRQWTIARNDLKYLLRPASDGRPRLTLPGRGFDAGYYRPGHGQAYAGIAQNAREFGDEEIAAAALHSLDLDCGRTLRDGVLSYSGMSNSANATQVGARLRRRGSFGDAVTNGPPEAALHGPILDEARYPDVLVAHALSSGADLRLVLYPGRAEGEQTIALARLRPGAGYRIVGGANDGLTLEADGEGRASATIRIAGRSAFTIVPVQ